MNLRNRTKQRAEQARRRLLSEIEANGITVHWKEPIYEPDGMNGYIKVRENKRTVRGILINAVGGSDNMSMTDSGRKEVGTHTLVILFDKCIRPEYLTEFYTHDNEQYRIVNVQDENNLHVAYNISCIHTPKRLEGYNGN